MPRRGTAGAWCSIWPAFSSRLKRETKSRTRSSSGRSGSRNGNGSDTDTLHPPSPLEPTERRKRAQHDEHERVRVPVMPAELGHELEIHAVDAGDQDGRHADDGHDGERLDD